MGRMKAVVFDLDGTLMRSSGAGKRAMQSAGRSVLGPLFSLEGVLVSGGLDPLLFREAAGRLEVDAPDRYHDQFRDRYFGALSRELNARPQDVYALPGVLSLVAQLQQREAVAVGLATGNYAPAARMKLEAAGIAPEGFAFAAYGDQAPDRPAMVALALERARQRYQTPLHASDSVVVGDTPRDVDCARANGCPVLAVATGAYSVAELQKTQADAVVPDLSDPEPLLRLLL